VSEQHEDTVWTSGGVRHVSVPVPVRRPWYQRPVPILVLGVGAVLAGAAARLVRG
jgi:hypothetical protein